MAAVAKRPSRTLEVVRRVKRRPPVGVVRHEITPPLFVRDVPLRRLRIIVVADLGEVALLPAAAVDERDVVFRKLTSGSGFDRSGIIASGCFRGSRTTFAIRDLLQRA